MEQPQATRGSMSDAAREFLGVALDSIQRVALRSDTLSWAQIRDSAFAIAASAERPIDTYPAISWALRRSNKHSFLQVSAPGAVSTILDGRIGYIHVPQRGGAGIALADSLHLAVRTLFEAGVCGWIVDVRANGGGNMWPMLAGIGPLLGDSLVGSFTGPDEQRWFYARGMSAIIHGSGQVDTVTRVTIPAVEPVPPAPMAVLFDAGTGSSGEAVVVAFLGRPMTRTFGSPSAGFATVNRGLRLPDSANMVITIGYNRDRTGRVQVDQLTPDVLVPLPNGWPSYTDRVTKTAAQWVREQQSCRSGR
jgi:C-terminal processing protease CtpA/Prc